MKNITVEWSGTEMAAVNNLIETLHDTDAPLRMRLEYMVLAHWHDKNYAKIYNAQAPYRFVLRDYQAYALRTLLMNVGLNVIEDVFRNGIVAQIDTALQLPKRGLMLYYDEKQKALGA